MLGLVDIRDYIATLDVAVDDNVYMGRLDNKKQKSIGVYQRKTDYPPRICLGETQQFEIKPITLLIHWNKSPKETEQAAFNLYKKLKTIKNLDIGETHIHYVKLINNEPVDVGYDDAGICEKVIQLDIIYRV